MSGMVERAGLQIAASLARFIEDRALPGTGLEPGVFWRGFAGLFAAFAPENAALLAKRDAMQAQIDTWCEARRGQSIDSGAYQAFLRKIGYLVPKPARFSINPMNVDEEIAHISGPQLVVPVMNARFVLNAANARWGSLYDALYGTDAIPGAPAKAAYDPERGAKVIAWAKDFLDTAAPLADGNWADFKGGQPSLKDPRQIVGRRGANILLKHNGLHIELVIDPSHPIGSNDPAGIADVLLEAALTTIIDMEDSVAAVDAEDKTACYENLLGLMRGELEATFEKNGRSVARELADDRVYETPGGETLILPGRSLLFVRSVGHLMTTPAVKLEGGAEAPEGVLDGVMAALIGLHDLKGLGQRRNSRAGSIYVVKPKMHGPEEVAFSNRLFDAIEDLLGLARHTLKIGVMDEERRTSVNLAACIAEVKDRVVFINTGFLDRTGDEIHTSMRAGAMVRKSAMKNAAWIKAYEDRNVQIGLACGFSGRAQIGKGMWAMPDRMADMLEQKIAHPRSGANTAWVPSPTAAVLHAVHYHRVDVFARQAERAGEPVSSLDALLALPLAPAGSYRAEDICEELDNNVQSILGYVVRWVDQGIGCSKVPDIFDVGLMEDRATLRISSQHIANWLLHDLVSREMVEAALERMALKVDQQNAGDPAYRPMAGRRNDSFAFEAARALIFEGPIQPNGYTEPLLHAYRARVKAAGRQAG